MNTFGLENRDEQLYSSSEIGCFVPQFAAITTHLVVSDVGTFEKKSCRFCSFV